MNELTKSTLDPAEKAQNKSWTWNGLTWSAPKKWVAPERRGEQQQA
jgi:hypothetical protein